jgi:hypothetical protein|tara:strand:+ start:572 stop:955 length:384 start_codon:yes stop_codon:yes gene_type:complete
MSNIKKFNITVGNLIDDLIIVCPTYEHLKTFKEQLNLLCKFNVRKSIEYFKNTVYIYKEQIVNKDENYFIKKTYNEDIEGLEYDTEWTLDQVLNLKELWAQLDDNNKETIWIYFNVLIKITELEYDC